jgi:hypothetical protein
VRDQSSDPKLHDLARALAQVLPEDSSEPRHLSLSALDICVAGHWQADPLLASAIDCARRFWEGAASDDEREGVRTEVVRHAESLRKESGRSPEWCRYALAMWSLDARTASTNHAADYLMEFALEAGIPLASVRQALEAHVPGLSAAIQHLSRSAPGQ